MKLKAFVLAAQLLLVGAAANADEQTETLAREALSALDRSLSQEFDRQMAGQLMYHERQSVAVVVGIKYSLQPGEHSDQWSQKVAQALQSMGTKRIANETGEVRGEQVPIAGHRPVAQFTASDDTLSAVVIYLLQ